MTIESKLIEAGLALDEGKLNEAEAAYSEALAMTEDRCGAKSPAVGMVLLDLLDLYDIMGDAERSRQVFERVREILVLHAGKAPELSALFRRKYVVPKCLGNAPSGAVFN